MNAKRFELPVGTRVLVAAHEHAFGACFLSGEAVLIENRDFRSRERGEVLMRFVNGTVGVLSNSDALTLVTELPT